MMILIVIVIVICIFGGGTLCQAVPLSSIQNTVFACDYTKPIQSVPIKSSGVPCSSIYTPVLQNNGFTNSFTAQIIEDPFVITTVTARLCYKLILRSWCTQRILRTNIETREFAISHISEDECFGDKACLNCEIGNSYPPYDCRITVIGPFSEPKEVIFATSAVVYKTKVGVYKYGSLESTSTRIPLSDSLGSVVYIRDTNPSTSFVKNTTLWFGNDLSILLSLELKRLLHISNSVIQYNGTSWALYDDCYINVPSMPSSYPIDRTTATKQRYFEMYLNATLNVTNWRLDYLDCRLKNLMLTTQLISKNVSMLDIGVGELYFNGSITRYSCSSVNVGSISSTGMCIIWTNGTVSYKLMDNGEVDVLNSTCSNLVRVNRTHVLNLNSDGFVSLIPYGYSSLQDEEMILRNPPDVVTDLSSLYSLIQNSNIARLSIIKQMNPTSSVISTTLNFNSPDPSSLFDIKTILIYTSIIIISVVCCAGIFCMNKRYHFTNLIHEKISTITNAPGEDIPPAVEIMDAKSEEFIERKVGPNSKPPSDVEKNNRKKEINTERNSMLIK